MAGRRRDSTSCLYGLAFGQLKRMAGFSRVELAWNWCGTGVELGRERFVIARVAVSRAHQALRRVDGARAVAIFDWDLRLRNGDTTGPESAYFFFQTRGTELQRTYMSRK